MLTIRIAFVLLLLIVQLEAKRFFFQQGGNFRHGGRRQRPEKPKKKKKNHYKALGLKKDATMSDIKRAYRKLSLKYHPDKILDPDMREKATRKIHAINEAYEILGDREKRQVYDDFGNDEDFSSHWEYQMAAQQGKVDKTKGFYLRNDDIIKLEEKTFYQTIRKQPMLVEFYAPWCEHCRDMVSEYSKAALLLDETVKVGAVNCVAQNGICESLGLNSYPTIKLFHHVKNAKALKKCKKMIVEGIPGDQNGVYVKKKLSDGKPYYKSGEWYLYYFKPKNQWIIDRSLGDGYAQLFVTSDANRPDNITETWSVWDGKEWKENANIGCRCVGAHTIQKIDYNEKAHTADMIYSFVDQIYNSPIVELTRSNFNKLVRRSKDIWLVDFSAGEWCGPCTVLRNTLRSVAADTQRIAKVGLVECDIEKKLCEKMGVSYYPQLRVFSEGSVKEGVTLPSEGHNPVVTGANVFKIMMTIAWNHNWTAIHELKKEQNEGLDMDDMPNMEDLIDDDDYEYEIMDDIEENSEVHEEL